MHVYIISPVYALLHYIGGIKGGHGLVTTPQFSFCTYSGRETLGISGRGLYGPDAVPVTQPAVLKH